MRSSKWWILASSIGQVVESNHGSILGDPKDCLFDDLDGSKSRCIVLAKSVEKDFPCSSNCFFT
jgi:hypothetical protein